MKSLLFLTMELSSLFKFKRKSIDIESLLEKVFDNVESDLFLEFQKNIYSWSKSDSIKQYECFIFSKFLINYSFSILHNDMDKNVINGFNKITEEIFTQLHKKKYSSLLDYKNMENIINQKYDLFYSLRKDNKPPECWYLIYSSFTGKNTIDEIQSEILGLQKAVKSLKSKVGSEELIFRFKNGIDCKTKIIESFDLAEISFRQSIRSIKKQLSSADIPQQLSSKK